MANETRAQRRAKAKRGWETRRANAAAGTTPRRSSRRARTSTAAAAPAPAAQEGPEFAEVGEATEVSRAYDTGYKLGYENARQQAKYLADTGTIFAFTALLEQGRHRPVNDVINLSVTAGAACVIADRLMGRPMIREGYHANDVLGAAKC